MNHIIITFAGFSTVSQFERLLQTTTIRLLGRLQRVDPKPIVEVFSSKEDERNQENISMYVCAWLKKKNRKPEHTTSAHKTIIIDVINNNNRSITRERQNYLRIFSIAPLRSCCYDINIKIIGIIFTLISVTCFARFYSIILQYIDVVLRRNEFATHDALFGNHESRQ